MMKENLEQIKERIALAAKRAGRNPEEIQLIAVSKTYPASDIEKAISYGCTDFGENKVQELVGKIEAIETPVNWHLIGHLQTNKVKYIVGKTKLIHSVDSLKLAKEIEKQSAKHNVVTKILIEVNVGEEDSKDGILLNEVIPLVKEISALLHVKVEGLMTVAPFVEDAEKIEPYLGNFMIYQLTYKSKSLII
nr:YggS family pyridoxal phosphate-dependent enzyme [Cellulosilyticum ruminicola]